MLYLVIVTVVVLLDQVTKTLITNSFHLYEIKEIIPGFFNLVFVTNTGAAFSILSDIESPWRHYFFVSISTVALVCFSVAGMWYRRSDKLYVLAFALIAGGAAGNLVDRIRYGAVVDFLDFHVNNLHWPAFNIADSAICIGAGLFIMINLIKTEKKTEDKLK